MASSFCVFLTLSLLSLVHCEPPANGYYQPNYNSYNSGSSYLPPKTEFTLPNSYLPPNSFSGSNQGSYHGNSVYNSNDHDYDHENEVPKSYEFGYSVKDAKSGNDYNRREASDGHVVRGEYRVQLPDGRTQIVTYHADWKTGFHADVRYEGEPKYPEQNQGYNYNVPDYSGSLTGFHNNRQNYKPSTSYGPSVYH